MKLIIGLGNPGPQYDNTRHNIGFRVLNEMCDNWTLMPKTSALICKQGDVIYAKPQTFMNLSGAAVTALVHYYKLELQAILVVYDCKDISFGKVKLKPTGSSAGHNGMNSIIGTLGTDEFPRLRIGIAPINETVEKYETADYVLGKFSEDEEKHLPEIIKNAIAEINNFTGIKKHSMT